jgi:hypothetical protein
MSKAKRTEAVLQAVEETDVPEEYKEVCPIHSTSL